MTDGWRSGRIVSLDPLARATRIALGLQGAGLVVLLVELVRERRRVATEIGAPPPFTTPALDADRAATTVLVVMAVLTVVTAVAWIRWFAHARRNVEAWEPQFQRFGPGWAVAGWLVPVANLVLPYMITRDVLDDTQRDSIVRWRTRPALMLWWLASVAYAGLIAGARAAADRSDLNRLHAAVNLEIVAVLVGALALTLAWVVLGQVTRAQAVRTWADLEAE